ncbi:DNA polymerase I [Dorea longicatena]|uniref:DNA polymerase I n=1 Tax=Dorea longicatena TaxID=88431 RepID=UPI00156E6558|nr:DNA polymerase I [Dorea longicatena]NSD04624.1 DNA polymerase I [Dorea longicatena]NSD17042.1 DNA polymerase I [Dorea longicatena]NSK07029.1 DNA polymerase I [Blautia sp. MSK.20.9]
MSSKIVLIDGHSILNRAFYGLPDLTNAEGLHTNAIYGFLTIMFKLLEEEKPEYLTVAFDVHAPTFRHKMYAEYKGTRKPMADELRQQVPVIKEVLHAMGVKTIECAGLEADDLIGTLSNRCENEGMEVTVISGDRDLLQLATEHVKIRIPKTKQGKTEIEDYYAKDVEERYQVTPKEFIDLKALMGDTADNIPGVPSIGEKTATKIITQYHSIEEAHEHVDELKPPRASKALSEHWDLAVLSKKLATINVKADFPYELSEAKLGNLYTEEAYIFFQKLEFKNLLSRFDVSAPANKVEDGFKIIASKSEAEKVFVQAEEASTIGAVIFKDLENVLPLFADQAGLGGIGLCFSKEESYCIKVEKDITGEWLLKKLADVAEKAETYAMFHLKESMEQVTIRNQANCFDISVAAYLLNPLKNNYTWEDVAREHLGLMIDEKIDQDMKACYESYVNYASVEVLRQKLRDTKMDTLFRDIEMPLVFTLFDMEQNGIRVEADALKQYGDQLAGKIAELEKEIYEEAGETFNINSPKQLGVVLFENMKLPGGRKTKTGYSTAADVLEKLAPEHPVVAKILEYRQYTKLKSTYADGLANYIQDDGRIHGKFNQTITATGRISSTEPNLQNIPVRMELGRLIRKVFIPEEGYRFVDADYSQIELRVLAHCSGDEHLIQAYKEQSDIHRITASQVFHIPFDEVTPQQRRNAKAVNFGIVYGISSFGLSQDLSITRKEAAKYIDDYFATYPGIKTFLDHAVTHAKEEGYVVTLFGRRRPVPELSSSNFMQRSFGERVAMNSPIQGAAADIIKIAMIRVNQRLKDQKMKSRLVLQVHDELLIEAYEPELDEVQNILKEEMEHAAELKVPLEIDMHTGDNWYEAK